MTFAQSRRFLSCLATSLADAAHYQFQALRVASPELTAGPTAPAFRQCCRRYAALPATEEITVKRRKRKLTLHLPDEFLDLCQEDLIEPEFVLRGFIADLCGIISWQSNPRTDGYNSNGSDERDFARDYYKRVGYPYWAAAKRDFE